MRYFGSKASTANLLAEIIGEAVPGGSLCDPFGGIAIVSQRFKQAGYAVTSGDILHCAHAFQVAKLEFNGLPRFEALKSALRLQSVHEVSAYLDDLSPRYGWIYHEFSRKRQFFTAANGAAIDSVRMRIDEWRQANLLTRSEDVYLTACLIDSMDRVANTAGTYYAFLKTWTRKAINPFKFRMIEPISGQAECVSYLIDAEQLAARKTYDILYLDPPYNERNYAGYYHLPETIATARAPRPKGRSGVAAAPKPFSAFTRPSLAPRALEKLLERATFRFLALHYSDEGLISPDTIHHLLGSRGSVKRIEITAPGYSTTSEPRRIRHVVYLVNP